MNLNKPIRITAVGKFLPKKVLSNDLEKKFNIPIGWSHKNSGVKQRHWTNNETVGFMGAKAAQSALDNSNTHIKEIDLLISEGTIVKVVKSTVQAHVSTQNNTKK